MNTFKTETNKKKGESASETPIFPLVLRSLNSRQYKTVGGTLVYSLIRNGGQNNFSRARKSKCKDGGLIYLGHISRGT